MDKEKPQYLNILTIMMGVLNLTGYLFISGDETTKVLEINIFTMIILFSYWVLYMFNKGANWARISVMIASGLAILNIIFISYLNFIILLVLAIEALLGVFLLYYLNLKYVKDYFLKRKDSTKES